MEPATTHLETAKKITEGETFKKITRTSTGAFIGLIGGLGLAYFKGYNKLISALVGGIVGGVAGAVYSQIKPD